MYFKIENNIYYYIVYTFLIFPHVRGDQTELRLRFLSVHLSRTGLSLETYSTYVYTLQIFTQYICTTYIIHTTAAILTNNKNIIMLSFKRDPIE